MLVINRIICYNHNLFHTHVYQACDKQQKEDFNNTIANHIHGGLKYIRHDKNAKDLHIYVDGSCINNGKKNLPSFFRMQG